MSDLSIANANAMLNAALVPSTTYYLSLHTSDPGITGANEVTGGSYGRQAVVFGSASGGITASTDSQTFTGMPLTNIAFYGIWSASTSGTYENGGSLGGSQSIPAGSSVTFAIGGVSVTVS